MSSISKVRFIGYAIPTTPANLISIGDPNGPGAVAGRYLGDPDNKTDINDREEILAHAIKEAKHCLPSEEDDVINIFVAPEFFFHGPMGAYIHKDTDSDPIDMVASTLADRLSQDEYPNWIFVCGSGLTAQIRDHERLFASSSIKVRNSVVENLSAQWVKAFGPLKSVIFDMLIDFIKNCHAYPNCQVRNRTVIINNPASEESERVITSEKYFVSNEDFLLYETNGRDVITEQMTYYPSLDLSAGDVKSVPNDAYAVFSPKGKEPSLAYGLEICLDHSDLRLRRNIDLNGPLALQIVPSCGMQIKADSVAAIAGGFVFNCDGQYALATDKSGRKVLNHVDSLYANYRKTVLGDDQRKIEYAAHSQLAKVKQKAVGEDPSQENSRPATFEPLTDQDIHIFPINASKRVDIKKYFAAGAGAIHIYGLNSPYEINLS